MKGVAIRGKADGKFKGVSSLAEPKDAQGKTFRTFILYETIIINVPENMCDMLESEFPTQNKDVQVALVNSKVNDVVIKVSNKIDDNVDDFVSLFDNNEFHAKSSTINKDDFVSEAVNYNEVINDDFTDDIFIVNKFPKKGKKKKTTPSSAEHDVEELFTHILHDIVDNMNIN